MHVDIEFKLISNQHWYGIGSIQRGVGLIWFFLISISKDIHIFKEIKEYYSLNMCEMLIKLGFNFDIYKFHHLLNCKLIIIVVNF